MWTSGRAHLLGLRALQCLQAYVRQQDRRLVETLPDFQVDQSNFTEDAIMKTIKFALYFLSVAFLLLAGVVVTFPNAKPLAEEFLTTATVIVSVGIAKKLAQ
jgi:hypothetical protein